VLGSISLRLCLAVVLSSCVFSAQQPAPKPVGKAQTVQKSAQLWFRPADPLNAQAFDHFYNMDYDISIQEFTQIVARHPEDPDAIDHLLTVVLFHELYRMGALNAGEYANDSFINTSHRTADPRASQQIKSLVQKALSIEEKRLAVNSKEVRAIYARGVTRAQLATYTALIEHAWFSALRNAVGARHDHAGDGVPDAAKAAAGATAPASAAAASCVEDRQWPESAIAGRERSGSPPTLAPQRRSRHAPGCSIFRQVLPILSSFLATANATPSWCL